LQSIKFAAAGVWDNEKQALVTWDGKYCVEMHNVDDNDSDYEIDGDISKRFEISFDAEVVGPKDTSTVGSVETIFTSIQEAAAKNTRSVRSSKGTGTTLQGSTNSISSLIRSTASSVANSSRKSVTSGIMDASITKESTSMKLEMVEIKKLL
jgi:hypothetical protein